MVSYIPAVAIPTLIGSLLSWVASGLILVCYIILPQKRHFRHILIINLALADFVNSMNNSISGIFVFIHGGLTPGPACTFNGWVGQFSVQGTDFSILFIAIVTVAAFKKTRRIPEANTKNKILMTLAVWFVPLVTSTTGLGLHDYAPVSGNWCWLSASRPGLRYALGHGWRFAIVFISICLYIILYVHLRHEFREVDNYQMSSTYIRNASAIATTRSQIPHDQESVRSESEQALHPSSLKGTSESSINQFHEVHSVQDPHIRVKHEINVQISPHSYTPRQNSTFPGSKKSDIQKLLLLNAYPIAYIILWIPGLLNRIMELIGHNYRWLEILQSSTQYIGLANAITYGWTEVVRKELISRWRGMRRRA